MDTQLTAMQVFTNLRTKVPSVVKAMEEVIKAGGVRPVVRQQLEESKNKAFKEFVAQYKIPIVEQAVRAGGMRGGIVEAVKSIFNTDDNHPAVKIASQIVALEKQLNTALEPAKRELSFAYVRGPEKAPAAAPAPAPAK